MTWWKQEHKKTDKATPANKPRKTPLGIMALEPRVMFDGAAVATAVQAAADTAHTDATVAADVPIDASAHDVAPAAEPRNVVFVDVRVEDSASLLNGIATGSEVVFLQAGSDGLQQMANYLEAHPGADSVTIIAHGNTGDLWLGGTYLSSDNLAAHADTLAAIGADIKSGGDILIYACNTAQGDAGLAFVDGLAALTQRDIAASSDRTGAGYDWDLEITTGSIEAVPVLSSYAMAGYGDDLATLTVTTNADSGAGSLRNAITAAIAGDTITFNSSMTITLTSGQLSIAKNLIIDGDLDDNGTADVTLDADYNSRVINITAGTVTLDGLIIQHGVLAGTGASQGGMAGSGYGAGISNAGVLTLKNSTITENFATGGGGAPANNAYVGGGGGGGSGAGGKGGAAGGSTIVGGYSGQPGSGSSGGNGGSYNGVALNGRGGTSAGGGAGGSAGVSSYMVGGAGGTATAGGITIGGGGGGAGWADTGGAGGHAGGAIFNSGTLYITTSLITNNAAAGGGGAGGYSGGAGGTAVGGIWNTSGGTVHITAASFAAMSGNDGVGGAGGGAQGGGAPGATGGGSDNINALGTIDTAWTPDTTPPTVTGVTSSTANGTYNVGDTISIQVSFDENVIVTGTPQLTLETGATDRVVNYASGSGSSTLTFSYTIQAGDTAADLDYLSTSALALNSGTIRDAAGNNATLTLASPGAAGSLGANKALVVDGVAPGISGATVPSNSTYVAGQNLDFTVTYDEAVTVSTGGGTPYVGITLDTGGSVQAAYVSGSGTNTLTFRYTVASGNLDSNGIAAATAITLNGGTIQDAAGNNAATTAIGFGSTASVLVDGVVPSMSSINRVSGSTTNAISVDYTVTFSESVSGVDTADFALTATGTAAGSIASISGSGTTYTVTVNTISGDGTLRLDLNGSGTGITDAAGNAIGAGYTSGQTYTIDNTAPNAPSAPDMTTGSDTGTSTSDNITSSTTPTFSGTAESGSTVTLYDTDGVTVLGTSTATGGNWSITSSVLSAGSHTVTVRATDAAGNISSTSSGLAVTIDTSAPTGLNLDTTTVPTNSATSTSTIATLSATDAQAITYTLATGNGTNDADNGSFTISGNSLRVGGSSLTAGTYHIYVAATDAAGNVANQAFTISIVDAPSVSSIVRTGGASATVNTAATSIQYTVTFSEAVTGVDTSDFALTATGTAAGSIASVSGSGTTYTVTVNTLSGDGTLRVDLNNSGTGIQNGSNIDIAAGYTSGSTYTLDHTAPGAPAAPDMTSGTDSGASSSDNITNDTTPTFAGTAESGSTVTLYDTDGVTVLGTGTATGGNWSITSSALSAGAHTITARATDAAGNVSSTSSGLAVSIDTAAPAVTSVGVPSAGNYAAGDVLTFTVNTGEAVTVDTGGGTPRLALDIGGSTVYATYASGSGSSALTFTYTVQPGDADGDGIAVTALQSNGGTLRDTAGNNMTLTLNSVGATNGVLIDTTAPTVSSVSVPANGSYAAGQNLDFTVNFAEAVTVDTAGGTPRVALTVGGSTVYADYLSGSGSSALVFRYTVQSGDTDADGIAVGALGGTVRDAAGNDATLTLNSVGSTASVLVDTTAPAAPSVPDMTAGSDTGSSATDNITSDTTPTFTGTAEAGSTVTVYVDGVSAGTTTATGGIWSFTPGAALGAGAHTITATAADTVGNVSAASSGLGITIDVAAPAATVAGLTTGTDTGSSATDGVTSNTTPTVTGTAEANSSVTVYVDGSSADTVTADGSGVWSYTIGTALTPGSHAIRAEAVDAAGNTGAQSAAYTVTIDTTAPTAPAIAGLSQDTAVTDDGSTTDTTPTITGTAEANSSVTVYVDGSSVGTATADGSGAWSFSFADALSLGDHSITAVATDAAGNASSPSAALAIAIAAVADEVPPVVPSTPAPEVPPPAAPDTAAPEITAPVTFVPTVTASSATGTLAAEPPPTTLLPASSSTGSGWGGQAESTALSSAMTSSLATNNAWSFETSSSNIAMTLPLPALPGAGVATVTAMQADGRPLPSWLRFDPVTGELTGSAPPGMKGNIQIKLIATDGAGNRATNTVTIKLSGGRPQASAAPVDERGGERPVGRAALHSQFAAQRFAAVAADDAFLDQLALAQSLADEVAP